MKLVAVSLLLTLMLSPIIAAEAPSPAHPQVSAYFPLETFRVRRAKLAEKLGDGIAIILGAKEPETYIPFRQNNTFFYFTGLEIPGAVLWVDGKTGRSTLFLPELTGFEERESGPHIGPGDAAGAIRLTGVDNVTSMRWLYPSLAFGDLNRPVYTMVFPEELAAGSRDRGISTNAERFNDAWDGRQSREMKFVAHMRQQFPTVEIRDLTPIVDALRWVKDEQEIRALHDGAAIAVEGFNEAIRATRPGLVEHEIGDVARYVWARRGARNDAYFPVIASGKNSNLTHYNANSRTLQPNDLIVMDYAPEFQYEDTDITRTWPASGKFNDEQTAIYNALLEAHRAMIDAIKPGTTVKELKTIARAIYDKHGLGDRWPGGIGHFVGMSVHDPGPYERAFVPGVVFNVEPMADFPEKGWHFRIEDTVLVTKEGHEVLTSGVPWELPDLYRLRDEGSKLQLPAAKSTSSQSATGEKKADWRYPRQSEFNNAVAPEAARMRTAPVVGWSFSPSGPKFGGSYIAAADLNGDGLLELVVGDNGLDDGKKALNKGTVYCLRATDGALVWKQAVDGRVQWASPVIVDIRGDGRLDVVVGASDQSSLYALDGRTGTVLWKSLSNLSVVGMAVARTADRTVIAATDYQSPRKLHFIDGSSGQEFASVVMPGTSYNIPAVAPIAPGGQPAFVLMAHDANVREHLFAFDTAGRQLWNLLLEPTAEQMRAAAPQLKNIANYGYISTMVADYTGKGRIGIGAGTDMNFYIVDSKGHLLARYPTGIVGDTWTKMLAADGTVTYRDHHFQMFDGATGDLNGDGCADIVVGQTSEYNMDYDQRAERGTTTLVRQRNSVQAISGCTGKTLWTFSARHQKKEDISLMAHPILADIDGDGHLDVLCSSSDGTLYAIDGRTGQTLWEFRFPEAGHFGRGMIVVDSNHSGNPSLFVTYNGGIYELRAK